MFHDMLSKENTTPVVTGVLIRSRKINIYLVFITQSYFSVSKNVKLNSRNSSIGKSKQATVQQLIIHYISTFKTI